MLDEISLVIKLKHGDHSAFIDLYDEYHTRLYNFVYASVNSKDESKDIVQIIFMRLWERHDDINPNLQFGAYLYTIARHLIYNHLRAKLYRKFDIKATETIEHTIPNVDNNEELLIETDFRNFFANLIEQLPERRRQIFMMSRSENKSYIQIAKELNITENTVDTQIRKSLDFLRKNLKKEEVLMFLGFLNSL